MGGLVVAVVAACVAFPAVASGQGPAFQPSDHSLVFDGVRPGQTSAPRDLTVRNGGDAPLTITKLEVSGYNFGDFAVSSDTCVGRTLQPGETCVTSVVFKPTTSGTRVSNLKFTDNTACPNWIVLAGSGDEKTQTSPRARSSTCAGPPPAAPTTSSRSVIVLPAPKCVSRRLFTIQLRRPRGQRITEVRVTLRGKRFRVIRGRNVRARVDLRGLPRGRWTVRIRVKTNTGRTYERKRRYVTCLIDRNP